MASESFKQVYTDGVCRAVMSSHQAFVGRLYRLACLAVSNKAIIACTVETFEVILKYDNVSN